MANTRKPNPFLSGRWRCGKRPWARSIPTWPQSLNNFALVDHKQGQYAKAEPLLQRALAMREKALSQQPQQPSAYYSGTIVEYYFSNLFIISVLSSFSRLLCVIVRSL
jgi:tetratricopeptide (TPR) repeat protein